MVFASRRLAAVRQLPKCTGCTCSGNVGHMERMAVLHHIAHWNVLLPDELEYLVGGRGRSRLGAPRQCCLPELVGTVIAHCLGYGNPARQPAVECCRLHLAEVGAQAAVLTRASPTHEDTQINGRPRWPFGGALSTAPVATVSLPDHRLQCLLHIQRADSLERHVGPSITQHNRPPPRRHTAMVTILSAGTCRRDTSCASPAAGGAWAADSA